MKIGRFFPEGGAGMSMIEWNTGLSVKVEQLDEQHRELVDIINELHNSMKAGTGRDLLRTTLDRLVSYTSNHFLAEEQLMAIHAYPDAAEHKYAHESLMSQVVELQHMFKSGKTILTLDILLFLRDWLTGHIQVVDKKFGAFLNLKGIS